jgi:hypothetical protein
MDKFKTRNLEKMVKLNEFIDSNVDNIHMILASPEMYEWLKQFYECDVKTETIIYYKGKGVQRMDYFPPGGINFVFKNSYIKFELPCICGLYKDEQHLHP